MKLLFTLVISIQLMSDVLAQSPEKMSYQAVIRNNNNELVASSNIGMQISILQGSVSGEAVYVEQQFPTTNINGLVGVEIGAGLVKSGSFSTIKWGMSDFFIKTETDLNGGEDYTITGVSQLLSVPYALHAKTAETISSAIINCQVAFSVSEGIQDIKFTKNSTSIFVEFPSKGTMYATGEDGQLLAETSAHLGQIYEITPTNNVLVWNIKSDEIVVQGVDDERDFNNIVLLRNAYNSIAGGKFESKYTSWEAKNISQFHLAIKGGKSPEFSVDGSSNIITFDNYGDLYIIDGGGVNVGQTSANIGQSYRLSGNVVLLWDRNADEIIVQGITHIRNENSVLLLASNYGTIVGGYYAPQFWNWELNRQLGLVSQVGSYNAANVEFMSREGRVNGVPGNSYLSAYECKKVQINNIRVSLRRTLDEHVVLSHDEEINNEARNPDGSKIDKTINISETNLSILNNYDYGVKYGASYAGLKIAELEPMIDICAKLCMKLTLEFKYTPTTHEIESICRLIAKYSMVQSTWISTTNRSVLDGFNRQLNRLNIALIAYITAESIDKAATYKTDENNVRLDLFNINTITEDLWYQAQQVGVDLKVGSVYKASDILLWYNKGCKVIEVANIPYPNKWLSEYEGK